MIRPVLSFGLLAGLVWAAAQGNGGPAAGAADAETVANEKLLKDAGIVADGPGLLAYFRARVLHEEDRQRFEKAIDKLGDDSFEVRESATQELLRGGRFALAVLRPAVMDPDLERSRRAKTCVEDIERTPYAAIMTAAANIISIRRPPGTTEALLECLPWVDDESVREGIYGALAVTGMRNGEAARAVVDAATDREAARRAAAAYVLGRGTAEQRKAAVRLMVDADPNVRFFAAWSLLLAGEEPAVATLIRQLGDGPLPLAWRSEDLLCRLAGDKMPARSPGTWDDQGRRKCREVWEAWWKDNQGRIDLSRVNHEDAYLGLNVVAELDGSARAGGMGRVWECGGDGKARWEITNVVRSIDAQVLSGGRVLVAEHGQSRVTERDRDGKVLWEQKVASQPVSVKRLANGNTFIVTYNELLEVTPGNQVVVSHKRPGAMIYHGQKLSNGNMVVVQSNNQVIELDSAGKQIRSVPVGNTGGWASVERQRSGNYLVALYADDKVVEVDEMGKVLWECSVNRPGHATRLKNGNVLVASIERRQIIEFNRAGSVVWQQATQGRPFHVYRR